MAVALGFRRFAFLRDRHVSKPLRIVSIRLPSRHRDGAIFTRSVMWNRTLLLMRGHHASFMICTGEAEAFRRHSAVMVFTNMQEGGFREHSIQKMCAYEKGGTEVPPLTRLLGLNATAGEQGLRSSSRGRAPLLSLRLQRVIGHARKRDRYRSWRCGRSASIQSCMSLAIRYRPKPLATSPVVSNTDC